MLITNLFLHLYEFAFTIVVDFLDSISLSNFLSELYNAFIFVCDILKYVYYFLPVERLIPLFGIVFAVIFLKIMISVTRFVIELIPFY